jgi:hypothetical protein
MGFELYSVNINKKQSINRQAMPKAAQYTINRQPEKHTKKNNTKIIGYKFASKLIAYYICISDSGRSA